MEDIVYIFNHTTDLIAQLKQADEDVRFYLTEAATNLLNNDRIQEAIPGHLFYERQPERLKLINEKLKTLSNGI